MSLLFLCLLLCGVVSSSSVVEEIFKGWMQENGKSYKSQTEFQYRSAVFRNNLEKIDHLNRQALEIFGDSADVSHITKFAPNKFSDLTEAEFKTKLGYLRKNVTRGEELKLPIHFVTAPQTFDWVAKGKVTAVKNQEQCGSCWAFSATENIESVWMIAKDLTPSGLLPLAPQQIVDCDTQDGGCNGGDTPTAYEYVIKAGGMEPEKDYPYKAVNEACHFKAADVTVKISSWKYAGTKDEQTMINNVAAVSPLSICVDAEPWQFYSGGIMTAAQCGTDLDHCVQITGYDLSASEPFWTVRNSWGADWGEKGFIRLQYGKNTCGVAEEPTTAVV